jgi:hypothetical protein
VSIWFSKFANRLLPELDAPELDVSELDVLGVDVPEDELGLDEVGLEEVGEALDNEGPEILMSTIAKLSSVIVVPEPAFTPLDADEFAADPTP